MFGGKSNNSIEALVVPNLDQGWNVLLEHELVNRSMAAILYLKREVIAVFGGTSASSDSQSLLQVSRNFATLDILQEFRLARRVFIHLSQPNFNFVETLIPFRDNYSMSTVYR